VSQMDALSMSESHHQRLHWLSEQVLNWSGLPVVHVRPTVFLDSPLFTTLAARSIADSGTIRLPFGTGRTSPITTDDVARVVATILTDSEPYIGRVIELTGPRSQDMNGVAEEYARALNSAKPSSSDSAKLDSTRSRKAGFCVYQLRRRRGPRRVGDSANRTLA